jgi:hypothetical protein
MQIDPGATLNIMGAGEAIFTGTNSNNSYGGLYVSGGNVNLYGGAFSVAEEAVTRDMPFIDCTTGQVTVKNAIVEGRAEIGKDATGNLTLEETAQVEDIRVSSAGKLTVAEGWSGYARVAFDAEFVDNRVPADNASATSFTGMLTLLDGTQLKATTNGQLRIVSINANLDLDADGKAECPICEEVVTWTKLTDGGRIGNKSTAEHWHYYLSNNVTTTTEYQFANMKNSAQVCLHLNGNNLTISNGAKIASSTLNIMGNGNVDFTGCPTQHPEWLDAAFQIRGGKINLYGGTYTVSGLAAQENKSIVRILTETDGQVILDGATLNATARVDVGNLSLRGTSKATDIRVANEGKLTVNENWSGTAQVDFASLTLDEDEVPAANSAADGEFPGVLTTPDGSRLIASKNATLKRGIVLSLNANFQAPCPACNNEIKTWTAFSGNSDGTLGLGRIKDGAHHHIYLSADVNARNITTYFARVDSNSTVCLHLNGHDIVSSNYVQISAGTLNIMGSGEVTFTNVQADNFGGLYTSSNGVLNLYGGTYNVAETALTAGKPTIYMVNGQVTVKDATVRGESYINAGVFTLEETAQADNIQVGNSGKLTVAGT